MSNVNTGEDVLSIKRQLTEKYKSPRDKRYFRINYIRLTTLIFFLKIGNIKKMRKSSL